MSIERKIDDDYYFCKKDVCDCFKRVKQELRYSIFSHRWEGTEVTFRHFQMLEQEMAKADQDAGEPKSRLDVLRGICEKLHSSSLSDSFSKLVHFLRASSKSRCRWAWADTICIDKTSSAETDECIRSMFNWYRNSYICIVFLAASRNSEEMEDDPWFTRGWTLQELLAPKRLAFYSSDWWQITSRDSEKQPNELEDERQGEEEEADEDEEEEQEEKEEAEERESDQLLWPHISKITGIDLEDLHNFKPGLDNLGKKLSWASKRETTLLEDLAYCLVGMLDINLSVAYGEKERAFYRLQLKILKNSDDLALFDWQGKSSVYSSMLAGSPACFLKPLGLHTDASAIVSGDPTFTQTNVGIRISLAVHQLDGAKVHSSWKLPGATAFSILGASPKSGYHIILILSKFGNRNQQYKRVALIEDKVNVAPYKKAPEVVFIK
ncbi:hypothetical protein FRC17_010109 [Serendipita sp. 399]|nr:hypothetical protein FRC17_010109 [Serendipita sp. 399]